MRKATFVGKYYGRGYDAHMVYLVYSYRGHNFLDGKSSDFDQPVAPTAAEGTAPPSV